MYYDNHMVDQFVVGWFQVIYGAPDILIGKWEETPYTCTIWCANTRRGTNKVYKGVQQTSLSTTFISYVYASPTKYLCTEW